MDQHLETIGAFIDGERVDAEALRAALAFEEGRAYLVELAAMRELVAMPSTSAAVPAPRSRSVKFLLAAAALVAAVGVSGYSLGRASRAAEATASSVIAPEPTKVMKLETGVDWNESRTPVGGN